MRKILFILLFIFPVFTFAQTRVKVGNLYYNINGTTATVARYFYNSFTSDYRESLYEIPENIYYNGVSYTVIGIDDFAFSAYKSETYGLSASGVRTVKIPKTVKTIGRCAFYECKNLRNVIFTGPDNSLTEIGASAFNGCIALSRILVPANVKRLGNGVFDNSYIQTIEYMGVNPPENWVAAEKTYVTSKFSYKSPATSISDIYDIEELVSFTDDSFIYNANNVSTSWNANYEKDWECITMPELEKDAGEYRVNISFSFTPYYCNSSSTEKFHIEIPYFYTISPLTLTATAQDAIRTYGDNNPTFEVKYSGFINNEDESVLSEKPVVSTTASPKSDVGTFPITVSGGSAKNYALNYKDGVLTIAKAPLSARVVDASRLYGAENPNFSLSYQGLKNNETVPKWTEALKIETIATKQSDVGTYAITATGVPTNYDLEKIEDGTLTITQAPLLVKANTYTRKQGEENPNFVLTYEGFLNNDTEAMLTKKPSATTSATKESIPSEYEITVSGGEAKNYELVYINGKLIVTEADAIVLKAKNFSREYGADNPSFEYIFSGAILHGVPEISCEATATSPVGTYPIIIKKGSVTNYNDTYINGTLTITKRKLKATSHCSRKYGEENPVLPIEYDGFVNNEDESVFVVKPIATTTAINTSAIGKYPITISGGEATNYDFIYEQGVLTVTKASLSAKVKDATKVYGENNPSFSIEYYGLKNDETVPAWTTRPTFQTDATQSSGVGQYEVKALNGVPVNYDLGEITSGTLNITPASLTIKANDAARQYYSEEPNFNYTCSGFVNGENESVFSTSPVLSTLANLKSNVGTYEIKVSETTCQNYSISHVNGTLTITPRTLIASVGNYERMYNEENPEFEVIYNGFVGGEDDNVLSQKATANTAATKSSDVGTYPINVTGGSADNYKFSYTSGTLTINKAEQTILWEQDLDRLLVGDQVELKAVASSGLPITYTIDNPNIAEIYSAGTKMFLDCKMSGHSYLRAVQNGNKNYYSSPRVSNIVSIVDNEIYKADLNGDGLVNVGDVMAIINFMAGHTMGISLSVADINGDGNVDVGDIMAIINLMAKLK